MTLPQKVQDAVNGMFDTIYDKDCIAYRRLVLIRAELHRLTEIAEGVDPLVIRLGDVTTRLETANALLLRYCVQVGELTKWLDPHDPIFFDIQQLGADYMKHHLQGAGDEG
jgi:hypothetical protein